MRRILFALTLAAVMLFCCTMNATALTKQEQYDAALDELKAYMNDIGNMTIEQLYDIFNGLGSYEYSVELAMYTRVLKNIADRDFSQTETLISLLQMNRAFVAFVQEEGELGTVETLDWYTKGLQAEMAGDQAAAIDYYQKSVPFMDSFQRMASLQMGMQAYYDLAQKDLAEGRKRAAFYNFLRAGDYKDALIQARMLGKYILSANGTNIAAINSNGEVYITDHPAHIPDVAEWQNIDHLGIGDRLYIAFDESGKTYVAGPDATKFAVAGIEKWKECYSDSYAYNSYAVIRTDGTIAAYYHDGYSITVDEKDWENIVDVKISWYHVVGLTKYGKVIAEDRPDTMQKTLYPQAITAVAAWKDIRSIFPGASWIYGVQKDGTVVTTDIGGNPHPEVSAWKDIAVIVVASSDEIFGLKCDGTVVVADDDERPSKNYDEDEISQWKDIVAITATDSYIVGMKSDGTLVCSLNELSANYPDYYDKKLQDFLAKDLLVE